MPNDVTLAELLVFASFGLLCFTAGLLVRISGVSRLTNAAFHRVASLLAKRLVVDDDVAALPEVMLRHFSVSEVDVDDDDSFPQEEDSTNSYDAFVARRRLDACLARCMGCSCFVPTPPQPMLGDAAQHTLPRRLSRRASSFGPRPFPSFGRASSSSSSLGAQGKRVSFRSSSSSLSESKTRLRSASSLASMSGFKLVRQTSFPGALPAAASAFVGRWTHRSSEGYDAFLDEVTGLSWALRKIATNIHPYPVFSIVDGELVCETFCPGARMVREVLMPGETQMYEPNMAVDYVVTSHWEGAAFVATRTSDAVNDGKPTVQRRWLSGPNELTMTQEWGGATPFTAVFTRDKRAPGVTGDT